MNCHNCGSFVCKDTLDPTILWMIGATIVCAALFIGFALGQIVKSLV